VLSNDASTTKHEKAVAAGLPILDAAWIMQTLGEEPAVSLLEAEAKPHPTRLPKALELKKKVGSQKKKRQKLAIG